MSISIGTFASKDFLSDQPMREQDTGPREVRGGQGFCRFYQVKFKTF